MRQMNRLSRIVAWVVAGAGVSTLIAAVVVPAVMGWVPLTVLSGSMEPTYPAGSQVIVERIEGNEEARGLEVGDVITFIPEADSAVVVTHRITAKQWRHDGVAVFTTRGDANDTDDEWRLTGREIRGKVVYHVPYVGYIAHALDQDQKDLGIGVLACALLGYSGWQFLTALRIRRGRGRALEDDVEAAQERVG